MFWRAGKWLAKAMLCLSLVRNQREVPLPLSDIRWSTFDARLRIWSGFEVNTRAFQRSFSLAWDQEMKNLDHQ